MSCPVEQGIQTVCESDIEVCPRLYDDCDGNEEQALKEEREREYMDKFTLTRKED